MERQPPPSEPGAPAPHGGPVGYPPHGAAYAQPLPYQPWADPYQPARDADHLRILSICHYVWGAMAAVFSMCGLLYVFMGYMFTTDPSAFNRSATQPAAGEPPPEFMGYMFMGMGAAVVVAGLLVGGLTIYSGRCIARRKHRTFSLIMAGVSCLSVPVGTTLGVFTFLVLLRDSVRVVYRAPPPETPHAAPGTFR